MNRETKVKLHLCDSIKSMVLNLLCIFCFEFKSTTKRQPKKHVVLFGLVEGGRYKDSSDFEDNESTRSLGTRSGVLRHNCCPFYRLRIPMSIVPVDSRRRGRGQEWYLSREKNRPAAYRTSQTHGVCFSPRVRCTLTLLMWGVFLRDPYATSLLVVSVRCHRPFGVYLRERPNLGSKVLPL